MTTIQEKTARAAWIALLERIRTEGRIYIDQDGRECKELLNVLLTIENPADTLDVVREMQRQKTWVYPSPEELKAIILGSLAEDAHEYSYVPRLFGGANQIDGFVIPLLKQNPQSRRAVAILYKPDIDSKVFSRNVPGMLSITFRYITTLEATCHVRSNDVFIGFPANSYQLRCLQEYVAAKLGVQAGPLHIFSSSAHFFSEYEEEFKVISTGLKKKTTSTLKE
jgi:thymidylate synthase